MSLYDLGVVVYEYELKIGWGKSVSLPSQALPAPPPGHMAIRSKEVGTPYLFILYVFSRSTSTAYFVISFLSLGYNPALKGGREGENEKLILPFSKGTRDMI